MSLSDVTSSLKGLIRTHGGLQLLEDRNCIVRLDNNPTDQKVKLISGGGSGHEPAHAGFVGKGMLTGAICGNIFSSPSVTAILDCLKVVAHQDGSVIFIVKNYTGDRLNFGIALERAQSSLGFNKVRMLLVGEDCSIDDRNVKKSVGKRGLAGVVMVHKILGAMAEMGCSINDVYSFGEGLLKNNIATIGFTFHQNDDMLENIEIGKGIHGEPGVYTMDATRGFEDVIDILINKLISNIPKAAEVALLVNNLGGTSEFLMGVFIKAFSCKIEQHFNVTRIYCGTYLSSLGQQGISVTLLNLGYSTKLIEYLDFDVTVPCTLFGKSLSVKLPISESIIIGPPELQNSTVSEETFVLLFHAKTC
ncbi:triokinase/FMN cyclase-like isoform X2 [Toxorhynchites rutilus septentrionalis]|uniref:triokinase/FMN cyclase-like isoform X2 n=1 Tax=Toxorhynchites rutilus septentrionalis TaxID=329112 RepID=UPI002479CE4B|nr:triokinase/FMN cyclase-like isoform X2 [Toxorhynchites rutilus septentrionalis]